MGSEFRILAFKEGVRISTIEYSTRDYIWLLELIEREYIPNVKELIWYEGESQYFEDKEKNPVHGIDEITKALSDLMVSFKENEHEYPYLYGMKLKDGLEDFECMSRPRMKIDGEIWIVRFGYDYCDRKIERLILEKEGVIDLRHETVIYGEKDDEYTGKEKLFEEITIARKSTYDYCGDELQEIIQFLLDAKKAEISEISLYNGQ